MRIAATLILLGLAAARPAQATEAHQKGPAPDLRKIWLFPVSPRAVPPDQIIFSHSHHIKMGEDCVDCHPQAETATRRGEITVPLKPDCFECHDDEEAQEDCGMCHTNAENPSATFTRAAKEIRFNHAAHLQREEVTCATCHAGAERSESVRDRLVPSMSVCTTCHQAEMDRLACGTCHERLSELNLPPGDEAVHKPGFFRFHDLWATGNSNLCIQCHEQTFCSDCHGGGTMPMRPSVAFPEVIERFFMHRADYVGRHALDAAARPDSCQSCHGQTFCRDCHDTTRAFPGAESASLSPHPPGYVLRGGAAFHGRDARVNPQNCAACHDQGAASNCVDCHRVGGVGGNPHPPGWNRRGREQEMSTSRACLPCHSMGL